MSLSLSVPPERFDIVGHDQVRARFGAALDDQRLHPVWLLSGPRGIGKAQMALQLALMALEAEPGHKTEQAVLAGAHPDFAWIGKGDTQDIPVSAIADVRRLFARRAAMQGARVVVIDAVDDLNRFGVNAMLKTLEEPPPRSLFLLVHHREKRLLPTLVSRCMHVAMSPLSETDMRRVSGDVEPDLARLIAGRPGRAQRFADPQVRTCIAAARRLIGQSNHAASDVHAVLTSTGRSADALSALETLAFDWCADNARNGRTVADAACWAAAYAALGVIRHERAELMLDPAQTAARLIDQVHRARKQCAAP